MSRFQKACHVLWCCQYHIVWTPKYRFRILRNKHRYCDGLAEETQSRCRIPLGGQQKVDGLPRTVDCPIQVFPLALYFDAGFVHSPEPV